MPADSILWQEPKDYTLHSAEATNATGTVLELNGRYGGLLVQVKVAASWDGTATFQASQDGTNYITVQGVNRNTGGIVTTATADGLYVFNMAGVRKFKAPITGRTTGSVTVTATAMPFPPADQLNDVDLTATSVTVSAVTPGTGATNLGKAEDAAHTSADVGVMLLGVRKDTAAALAGADGDYAPVEVDANGYLHVKAGANSGVDIGDVDILTVIPGTGASNLGKAEDAAHSSADVGVMMLGVRKDTAAALAGADGDYAPVEVDANGYLHVKAGANSGVDIGDVTVLGDGIHAAATATTAASGTADVDAMVAAGAGLRLMGFAMVESAASAAAATANIVHGATGAGGTLLIPVNLSADESTSDWFGPDGIACASGISIDRVAGSTTIVVFTKTVA